MNNLRAYVCLILAHLVMLSCAIAADKPAKGARGNSLWVWIDTSISATDRNKIRTKVKQLIDDDREINPADLPVWVKTSNTNTTGRVFSIEYERRDYGNVTLTGVRNWMDANLAAPSKVVLVVGKSYTALIDAGYEPRKELAP